MNAECLPAGQATEHKNNSFAGLLVEIDCTKADALRRLEAVRKHSEDGQAAPADQGLLYEAFRA